MSIGYRLYKEWPEKGDYVLVTYKYVNPGSVIATLDEYPGKKGMIHISELSTRWIKDIKKEIKIGRKEVARVIDIDKQKGYITLSVKRVKPSFKREKTKEVKNEKRAHNFLKFVADKLGINLDDAYEKIGFPLQKEYGTMYEGFVLAKEGELDYKSLGISEKEYGVLRQVAEENIKDKEYEVKYSLTLQCYDSGGINVIKDVLSLNLDGVSVKYISAPNYMITVKATDYGKIENMIKDFEEKVKEKTKGNRCEYSIERVK